MTTISGGGRSDAPVPIAIPQLIEWNVVREDNLDRATMIGVGDGEQSTNDASGVFFAFLLMLYALPLSETSVSTLENRYSLSPHPPSHLPPPPPAPPYIEAPHKKSPSQMRVIRYAHHPGTPSPVSRPNFLFSFCATTVGMPVVTST